MGDQATFQMCGEVSTQNVRYYTPKGQPLRDFKFEKSSSREKLGVWVGLCDNGEIIILTSLTLLVPGFFGVEKLGARSISAPLIIF